MEFLFDEVEIMIRPDRVRRFLRLRVLPLAGRTKTGVVTRETDRRGRFTMRRTFFGAHLKTQIWLRRTTLPRKFVFSMPVAAGAAATTMAAPRGRRARRGP